MKEDGQTDRHSDSQSDNHSDKQTDKNCVPYSKYWESFFNSFVTLRVIHFFQSFMDYTGVYLQQETVDGAHKNSSTVDIDSFLWGILSGDWSWSFRPIYHRG